MSQLSDCEKKIFEPRFPSDYVYLLMCDDLYHVNEHIETELYTWSIKSCKYKYKYKYMLRKFTKYKYKYEY